MNDSTLTSTRGGAPRAASPHAAPASARSPLLGLGTPLQVGAMALALIVAGAAALLVNGYFVFVIAGVAMLFY